MTMQVVRTGLSGALGSYHIVGTDHIVFTEWSGKLSLWQSATSNVKMLATDWSGPETVVAAADGDTLYVTERGGHVLRTSLGAADRSIAKVIASGLDQPHQCAISKDGASLFVVEFGPAGRLLKVNIAGGTIDKITSGLDHAIGLAINPDETTAFVTEQAVGGGRLRTVDLSTGATAALVTSLINPFFLTWADGASDGFGDRIAPGTQLIVCERDPANRVSLIDVAAGHRTTMSAAPFRPSSAALFKDRLYTFCDHDIATLDVSQGLTPSVRLRLPQQSLFVGGWARVGVEVSNPNLSLNDIDFLVDGAPLTGGTSPSRDVTFKSASPEIMLLSGSQTGRFKLSAIERATGNVLGHAEFDVTTEWPDEANGPAVQFVGESRWFVSGAAWGGGAPGPQNANVFPASGTRRVAILLVDTTSSRYPSNATDQTNIRNEWQTELLGVVDADGITRGVRQYYQESSFGRFDIALVGNRVFGPVALPGSFTDYYTWNTDRRSWWANGNLWQACVTAAQDQIDFDVVDTLICVMRTVPATPTMAEQFAWPVANGGTFTYRRPGASSNSSRSFPCLTMPEDWETRDSRRNHETLAHEIGHNLGMGDLYNQTSYGPDISGRTVGGWDLMDSENPLPHVSLAHRLMLGWVQPDWVRSFDFRATGGVDQMLTLHAMELTGMGGPPAGRVSGIEVRRADGWNYYFEYRAGQVTQIGDRQLPTDRRVLGTDVTSRTFTAPQNRPYIVLLPNDPDGDGPVLGPSNDYEEFDFSGPANFQFDVVSVAADSAQVRVRYGSNGRPDPSIRPWPGGEVWQSPDIEISNERSRTRAEWRNTPWAGNPNTITARVMNRGNFVATNVQALFFVKDFTVGDAPEVYIGRDTKTIAANATVDFSTVWTPPSNTPENDAHYCVVVRIPLYQDPGNPAIVELTELNNLAQSNYTRFISATASPARRRLFQVSMTNPYAKRTRLHVIAQQSTPWYRTYIEHAWLWLDPGETRAVQCMVESLVGDPAFPEYEKMKQLIYERPHDIALIGFIENSQDPHLHRAEIMGGANVRVMTARQTRIDLDEFNKGAVRGRVVTEDDGQGVGYGDVIVSLKPKGVPDKTQYRSQGGRILNDGRFAIELGAGNLLEDWGSLIGQAHYLGAYGLSDCDSKVISLKQ